MEDCDLYYYCIAKLYETQWITHSDADHKYSVDKKT